jgi:hypothetical protein
MTKRRSIIRKHSCDTTLDVNVEMDAAGYFGGFIHEEGSNTRRYWQGIAAMHGQRILEKMLTAAPGCRPGFQYAIGVYPPIPLLADPPPENYMSAREYLDIDGVRFWHCGLRWQPCQAEYLRDLGVVDGAEWKRYLAWRRTGFEPRYVLDEAPWRPYTPAHLCH